MLDQVQDFASASQRLLSIMSDTLLSEDERSVIHYFIRELERRMELSFENDKMPI